MAVAFISTAKTSVCSHLPSSSPLPSICTSSLCAHKSNNKPTLCRAIGEHLIKELVPVSVTKRSFALSLTATFLLPLVGNGNNGFSDAYAAILEADDDEELLERVKKDRKKRIERQGVINSSKQETGYLQDVVYKLSEVGQAIDNNDLNTASSVLGPNTETGWIKKANSAFNKLSSSPEEKEEVATFNSSMAKLISSVDQKDVESSKIAFVSSAIAFEKWTVLTGLGQQLRGL